MDKQIIKVNITFLGFSAFTTERRSLKENMQTKITELDKHHELNLAKIFSNFKVNEMMLY